MTATTDKTTDETTDDEKPEEKPDDAEGVDESVDAAADPDKQPEESDVETDTGDDTPRSWKRRLLAGAAIVVFVAALAVSGILGWKLWKQQQLTRGGQQAQEAAVAYAQTLTSIDSNKVDENFNQVLDGATGEFKDMYSKSSTQLRQLLIDNKAAAHGVVVESAIQSETKDKVVVLLFVDQSVSNTSVPDPRIDRSRIKMTMEFADGRWRASQVELP
jgi:Mce-associated membrane protein